MSDRVIVTITDGIAEVRFNRPDKRNALDTAQFEAIAEAGESLKTADGVRAVVLVGEGASFCAGLDFSVFGNMADRDQPAEPREESSTDSGSSSAIGSVDGRITHLGQQVCWVWQEIEAPVIAAVQGHALGGGFQIALGADIRYSTPDAKWSVREVHWGLVPDMTGTFMLSRLVRNDIARELTYTARMIDGRQAHEYGIVTHLTDDPYADAMALATEIAGRSPGAVRGSKALFNNLFAQDAAEQFALERSIIGQQIGSPNQIEAIMSNMEKRAPDFAD
jgi:enoyl-CoA hydratase/carnithine racemase